MEAGHVAWQVTSPWLSCCHLTPALKNWAARWTSLSLRLNGHSLPPGLETFMRSTSSLDEVTLWGSDDEGESDTMAVHIQQALIVAPVLQKLRCNLLQPTIFPKGLQEVTFSSITWSNRQLEATLLRLQLLPLLEFISVELWDCEVILSHSRLAAIELPRLEMLELRMVSSTPHQAFDLSWLSDCDRSFELVVVLEMFDSPDELLCFSHNIRSVLQPSDSLYLQCCSAICQSAQQVLSELKLWVLDISIRDLSSIVMLPAAQHISLHVNLRESDFSDSRAPTFSTRLSWAAITSAKWRCNVVCDLKLLAFAHTINQSKCVTQLHVYDTPVGPAPWQQSLARGHLPWTASLKGWTSVTGMPAATSRTSDTFELKFKAETSGKL